MKIAIDAMGGDFAPEVIVQGAIEALPSLDGEIVLAGHSGAIRRAAGGDLPARISIVEASEVIEMNESPVEALRRKRDSSLAVAANLVKEGKASAMISAGSTGAATAAAHLLWRCLPNISRPAIATVLPSKGHKFVLIDSGATPDTDWRNLLEFAVMGACYAEAVLGVRNPRIGLLNIGSEEQKGTPRLKQAYKVFRSVFPEFGGNVEGKDMFNGEFDVVVCDGFVGNVALKTTEGAGDLFWHYLTRIIPKNKIARAIVGLFMKNGLMQIRRETDYAEVGGAPLLGVNGLCMICHGHSNAKAIKNAILLTQKGIRTNLNDQISSRAESLPRELENVS